MICQNGCSPTWRKWCSGICFEVAPVWLWMQLVNYLLRKLQQEVLFHGICASLKLSKTPENKRILVSIRCYTQLSSRKLFGDQAIHISSTEGLSALLFGLLSVALCLSHPPLVSSFALNKSPEVKIPSRSNKALQWPFNVKVEIGWKTQFWSSLGFRNNAQHNDLFMWKG